MWSRQGVVGVDEMLFQVFEENAVRYLNAVDQLATSPAAAQVAEELRRLARAWRALLELHRPTGSRGRCAGCRPRLGARRQGSMCGVWKVANAYFTRHPESH